MKYFGMVIVLIVLGASCARIIEVVEPPPEPGAELFDAARGKFADGDYEEALSLYEQYLEAYPEADRVPAAMLQIGLIRFHREEYGKARTQFRQVAEKFPETGFARQAQVEILSSYFREGRHDTALDYAGKLDVNRFPADLAARIGIIAGDAAMEKGAYANAFKWFMDAFYDGLADRREEAGMRLVEMASRMAPDELDNIIEILDGKPPAGYLLYGRGMHLAEEGRISEAVLQLSEFADRFPAHRLAEKALEKIAEFEQQAYFAKNRIGVLLPLTGEYGRFGRSVLRGIELALIEHSERRMTDPPLEIIVHDTGGGEEPVLKGVEALAREEVAAIIGPITKAETAARESESRGIPIITLSQQAGITEIGDYVFRNFLTPKMQVDSLVRYATGELGLERFAVLYPDEPYGNTFLHLFWDALIENGAVVAAAEKYDPEKTDFSDPIKKMVGLYYDVPDELKYIMPVREQLLGIDGDFWNRSFWEGELPGLVDVVGEKEKEEAEGKEDEEEKDKAIVDFDAVFIPDSPRIAGLIIPQLRYHDISDVYLLGTNLWHSAHLIDTAGRQLRQVVIPEGFYAQSQRKGVREFVRRFEGIYGDSPGIIEASGYDAAMMIFEQIVLPDIENRIALKAALSEMPPFAGMTGETVFDETGDARKKLYLLEVVRGRFSEIQH